MALLAGASLGILTAAMKKLRWTETETAHLAAHYPAISAGRLRQLLPERSEMAIKKKAGYLGLQKCHERRREAGMENVGLRWHPPTIET